MIGVDNDPVCFDVTQLGDGDASMDSTSRVDDEVVGWRFCITEAGWTASRIFLTLPSTKVTTSNVSIRSIGSGLNSIAAHAQHLYAPKSTCRPAMLSCVTMQTLEIMSQHHPNRALTQESIRARGCRPGCLLASRQGTSIANRPIAGCKFAAQNHPP